MEQLKDLFRKRSKEIMADHFIFDVEHLSVNYDNTPVLWDITFAVPSGKLVGIIGPNGAGKSTLLKASLGLVRPISGKVEFFGKPFKKVRNQIAYIPQRSSVEWDFPITVLDVVMMGRYNKFNLLKWPTSNDKKNAEAALDVVGMLSFAKRQISQLSGGQQQRIFVARALLQDADIYLMDEPFSGIDIGTEKEMINILTQLKNKGKTLFIVHHDLSTVERYFDWVVMLNTCLIASGPVNEVFHSDSILRTYGTSSTLLEEAARLTQERREGYK